MAANRNMNASFSALNSSLQQRWKAAQSKAAPTGEGQAQGAQLSNTMAPAGSRFRTEVTPAGQQPLSSSGANATGGQGQAGASNEDLTRRLQELKGKLAALKKD